MSARNPSSGSQPQGAHDALPASDVPPRKDSRRQLLLWVIGAGVGAFGVALPLPALALRVLTREAKDVAGGDVLVYATGDQVGLPIQVSGIKPGNAVQAFPQGKSDNQNN